MGVAERRERERIGREDLILKVATDLFARDGFENVSMAQIARDSELAKGTLYLYFQSKHELLFRILEPILVRHNEDLQSFVDHFVGSTEELFFELIEFFFQWHEKDREAYDLVSTYEAKTYKKLLSPEKNERLLNLMMQNLACLQKVIEQGIDEGLFKEVNPKVIAVIFWNILSSVLRYQENRLFAGGNDYRRSTLKTAMTLIFDGLKKN